ncbi:MAG: hypothetical protein ACUVWP_08730, partial [bacterium]
EKKEPYYKPGEIVPTPVPVEIVKKVAISGLPSPTTGEPCQDMWGVYNDCNLYPVYDENNIPIEYLVLAYRERSERLGMWEMLNKIKPYIYELMKLDIERATLERESYYSYSENKYSDIMKKMEDIRMRMNDNHKCSGYGWGYIEGIYELPPQMSEFHNGCIPILFIYYFKALDEVKKRYNTEDVEFICFRTFGSLGIRGWEFRAGDKRLYVTVYTEGIGGEPRGKIFINEITSEMKSFWIEEYNENYKVLWKEYESEGNEHGMINNNNMPVYMLSNVADFSKYHKLPAGSCAHVAASNILAYQHYRGYEQIPYDWFWTQAKYNIGWDQRSQWITYAKDNPNYKNNDNYGWQFQISTYLTSGNRSDPGMTYYLEGMISWFFYEVCHSERGEESLLQIGQGV